jgi:hypothetical protein
MEPNIKPGKTRGSAGSVPGLNLQIMSGLGLLRFQSRTHMLRSVLNLTRSWVTWDRC